MKQYPLEHPMFDGYVNGSAIHRRALLRQLAESHEVFKYCPSTIRNEKIKDILLTIFICALCILSTFTLTSIWEAKRTRNIVIKEIYSGNSRQVEENKMNAMKHETDDIAFGIRRNYCAKR